MTKFLISIFSVCFAITASAAEVKEQVFSCDGPNRISLQFAGPRYADDILVELPASEINKLLLPGEQAASGSIRMAARVGTCKRGDGNPIVIECSVAQDTWILGGITFTRHEKIARDVAQSVTIDRRFSDLSDLKIKVTKVNDTLQLDFAIAFKNSIQGTVTLKTSHELAALGEYPNLCHFGQKRYF